MKKTTVRPLQLNRETLRELTPENLERIVVGGFQEVTLHNSCDRKVDDP